MHYQNNCFLYLSTAGIRRYLVLICIQWLPSHNTIAVRSHASCVFVKLCICDVHSESLVWFAISSWNFLISTTPIFILIYAPLFCAVFPINGCCRLYRSMTCEISSLKKRIFSKCQQKEQAWTCKPQWPLTRQFHDRVNVAASSWRQNSLSRSMGKLIRSLIADSRSHEPGGLQVTLLGLWEQWRPHTPPNSHSTLTCPLQWCS